MRKYKLPAQWRTNSPERLAGMRTNKPIHGSKKKEKRRPSIPQFLSVINSH
jgi:hypothetical protein